MKIKLSYLVPASILLTMMAYGCINKPAAEVKSSDGSKSTSTESPVFSTKTESPVFSTTAQSPVF